MQSALMAILLLFLAGLGTPCSALDESDSQDPSVVVHFDKGKAFLSAEEKQAIHALFSRYRFDERTRVFILGYTDSSGGRDDNYALSRKRAQSVRREIISSFGVDATIVMALGKGDANPVADNGNARGQARNRRAEIYLIHARQREPQRQYGDDDPYLPEINALVDAADAHVRAGQLDPAIAALNQAQALGGDHYARWNTLYGIAGYYAHAPAATVKAHLSRAIQLDAHDFRAREYLGRMNARQKVAKGVVTRSMGRSEKAPIAVQTIAEAHEYLRLFEVEPVAHDRVNAQSIELWHCIDRAGETVTYFFDYAAIHDWGFKPRARNRPARDTGRAPEAQVRRSSVAAQPVSFQASPVHTAQSGSGTIWESAVFK